MECAAISYSDYSNIDIYFLKRKFTENVLQINTPNCTIDKKSEEYAPIPLTIVCALIHYLLFYINNEPRAAWRLPTLFPKYLSPPPEMKS